MNPRGKLSRQVTDYFAYFLIPIFFLLTTAHFPGECCDVFPPG
jgi:hypothetical protein